MSRIYNELAADWYRLLTPLHEYKAEAGSYHAIIQQHLEQPPQTILELGSGAGHVAYFLKQWYQLTLSDLSAPMVALSREINPELDHHIADMKTLQLGDTFDMVFVHDAIMYMLNEPELSQAMQTAFVHCRPGGSVLISPDYTRETFAPSDDLGGEDGPEGRAMRYLSWAYDPDPGDTTYIVDYAFLLRDAAGDTRVEHDRHTEGLFAEDTWIRMLTEAGFGSVAAIPDSFGRVNFLARRPGA